MARTSWAGATVVYREEAMGATAEDRAACEPSAYRATGNLVRVSG